MDMKLKIEESKLIIDWWEVFQALSGEDKREMVRQVMLFDQGVFDEIIEAVLTEEYSSPTFNDHIFKARVRMMERLPQMARDVMEKMQRSIEHSHEWGIKHMSHTSALEAAWPRRCVHCNEPLNQPRPRPPAIADREPTPIEKIDALMTACGVPLPPKEECDISV